MNVLVIGSGGREHALVKVLLADPEVDHVHVLPGNPGIAAIATIHPGDPKDAGAVVELCRTISPDLVVVVPPSSLGAGVADAVRAAGYVCLGASAKSTKLWASHSFGKQVMIEAGVPTPPSISCETMNEVSRALDRTPTPWVIKKDGPTDGRGILVTSDRNAAIAHAFKAGSRVLVEEFLDGPEITVMALCDGLTVRVVPPAVGYRQLSDGNRGSSTRGMGSYSPVSWASVSLGEQARSQVIVPVLATLQRRGTPYHGVMRVRMVLSGRGLQCFELGVTYPDPEAQSLLALVQSPHGQLLRTAALGELASVPAVACWEGAAVTVVVAAGGYPAAPKLGGPIRLPEDTDKAWILHDGTGVDDDGGWVVAGGRVVDVVGVGANQAEARANAYDMVANIDCPDGIHRTDIAEPFDDLANEMRIEAQRDEAAADPRVRGDKSAPRQMPDRPAPGAVNPQGDHR